MEKSNRKVLGVILLIFGALFLLNRLNIFTVDIFFNGWWTLLLIIPAILSMLKQGVTLGNGILLGLGVFLFLDQNGWNLSDYVLPSILIIVGLVILFKK
ncbi:MAG: hypothetical protein KKE16_04060 [Firmicutes bacterium]|nr:hypothetical protein [Bacillota bacterium]